jgi:hypothetical protein
MPQLRDRPSIVEHCRLIPFLCGGMGHSPEPDLGRGWVCCAGAGGGVSHQSSLLFLRAEELMHSKQDTLQFWVFVHVLEVHDFTISESSSDEFQRRRR